VALAAGDYSLSSSLSPLEKRASSTSPFGLCRPRCRDLRQRIDDDGNGLTDCDDPACATAANCQTTQCVQDGDLGNIDIGTNVTVKVDLTSATRTFTTECGKGDGHGRVYRLNLLHAMYLGSPARRPAVRSCKSTPRSTRLTRVPPMSSTAWTLPSNLWL